MSITVRIANNYGSRAIYPVCAKAKAFAAIARTTTLTSDTLHHVKTLGYTIVVHQPEVSL